MSGRSALAAQPASAPDATTGAEQEDFSVVDDTVVEECTSTVKETALASGSVAFVFNTGRADEVYLAVVVEPGRL